MTLDIHKFEIFNVKNIYKLWCKNQVSIASTRGYMSLFKNWIMCYGGHFGISIFMKNVPGWQHACHLDIIMCALTLNDQQKNLNTCFRFKQNSGIGSCTIVLQPRALFLHPFSFGKTWSSFYFIYFWWSTKWNTVIQ